MKTPILVAMVSVYNASDWLEARIENLLNTTIYERGELLIYCANASSTDPDDELICQKFLHLPNFKYELIPFCTLYAAWNHILQRTNTPYITNANCDDLIAPEAYDAMIEACKHHKVRFVYGMCREIDATPKTWDEVDSSIPAQTFYTYDPDAGLTQRSHFSLWMRSLHDEIGYFDPSFVALGDSAWWYKAWVNGIRDFLPLWQIVGAYRWRGEGKDGNLWYATDKEIRDEEIKRVYSMKPGLP